MKTISCRRQFLSFVGIFFSVSAWGQPTQLVSLPPQTSVNVAFFVTDHNGSPVIDIKQGDLTILDRKQPSRSILSLKRGSELPLRLGVLIDTSNSERWSRLYQPEVKSASNFLNQILAGPDDKAFVARFSTFPEEPTAFMNKADLLKYKVDLTPGGGTALYDAVAFACKSRMKAEGTQPARRVLILLSDGEDNLSHINHDEVIATALEAGVIIFAVSTADDSRSNSDRGSARLKQFAENTGGQAFLHLRGKDVENVFSTIREQIGNMYNVSYEPTEPDKKGFHAIEVKLSSGDKARLRTAKGYYVK
jgi:VWFA-related protein